MHVTKIISSGRKIDIGVFGQHSNVPSRSLLTSQSYSPNNEEVIKLVEELGGDPDAEY